VFLPCLPSFLQAFGTVIGASMVTDDGTFADRLIFFLLSGYLFMLNVIQVYKLCILFYQMKYDLSMIGGGEKLEDVPTSVSIAKAVVATSDARRSASSSSWSSWSHRHGYEWPSLADLRTRMSESKYLPSLSTSKRDPWGV
jgi:hypothetical protein